MDNKSYAWQYSGSIEETAKSKKFTSRMRLLISSTGRKVEEVYSMMRD